MAKGVPGSERGVSQEKDRQKKGLFSVSYTFKRVQDGFKEGLLGQYPLFNMKQRTALAKKQRIYKALQAV